MIPTGGGSTAPADFDIQVVEYTITCDATPPTAADFPGIDGIETGPDTFDPDITINGVLEVLDVASSGVTIQDFGPDLAEVFVWQGYTDIPKDAICSVQLRARDGDGEVICSATEDFDTNTVAVGGTVKVNVLMYCGVSFQAPVAELDLDGDFTFNIANFCPDLFVLNCIDSELNVRTIPGVGEVLATACQTRFRDGDSQCGNSCDPQVCVPDGQGLNCFPASPAEDQLGVPLDPAPNGVRTTVTCTSNSGTCAISCDGVNPAASCTFNGDTTGSIGDPPPGPFQPGEGGFFVSCATIDDDGDPLTPEVPIAPGDNITCTAVTTDGDRDCDKTETVPLTIEGLTLCQTFGGDVACQAASSSLCQVGTCNDATCDGATAAACCDYADAPNGAFCDDAPAPATCAGGVCVSQDCNAQPDPDGSCDDLNECTIDSCDAPPATTCSNVPNTGAPCAGGTGTCDGTGACIDVCTGVSCDDGNPCTDDPACDSSSGSPVCPPPVNNDLNSCNTCGGGSCICSGGACVVGCTVPAPQQAPGIPMACRNSFNQAVSTFPIDLLNVTANSADGCIHTGQAVDFDIDPVIALDTAFLEAAAQTLCDLGTFLTVADVTSAQISIDAVAGATCTEQLTELPGVPVVVPIPTTLTCVGGTNDGGACTSGAQCPGGTCPACGSGGITEVTAGISLPLPAANVPCTAGAVGDGTVQICSTGQVPLAISLTVPPPPPVYQETYVGVAVGGGAIQVGFACNTSSTTNPAPGVEVGCILTNPSPSTPAGLSCGVEVGTGDVGETPFPTSDCNTVDGPPVPNQICDLFGNPTPCSGTCDTVGVGVDPALVCAVFSVEP